MPTRPRLGLAAIAGPTAATAAYALLRCAQRLAFTEADPARIIYSEHAAFFWRCWMACFLGVTFAFAAWLAPSPAAKALPLGVPLAAALIALQSAFLP